MAHGISFIVNSTAGSVKSNQRTLLSLIQSMIPDSTVHHTSHPGHATELTRGELLRGANCVVAVGGDGTLNEVLNGFFDNGHLMRPNAALGSIMLGTGGDFRRTLGWSTDIKDNLERIKAQRLRTADVGIVESTHDNQSQKRLFMNVASLGISGQVVEQMRKSSFGPGKSSYFIATIQAFLKYRPQDIQVTIEQKAIAISQCQLLAFGNGQYFGGGMKIAPNASPFDGKLDAIAVHDMGLWGFLLNNSKLYKGTHLNLRGVTHCQTTLAHVSAPQATTPVLIEIDGERFGQLPATFGFLPAGVPIVT